VTTLHELAAIGRTSGFHTGLIATAFGFGFRHGIDWDHIAALTDITGSQDNARSSMSFATLYALGHGLVVFALGLAAVVLSAELPSSVDAVMAHFVGATLIMLAAYVFYSVARHGRDFRMRSRWMLLFSGIRHVMHGVRRRGQPDVVVVEHDHEHRVEEAHDDVAVHNRFPAPVGAGPSGPAAPVHVHQHRHAASLPDDPFMNYSRATSFGIGMVHGIGAETPTQILIFAAAAGAGGRVAGTVLLCCFLIGLLASNTVVALASTFGYTGATRSWRLYLVVSLLTATFSLVIGLVFLLGRSTLLPAIFGG
jgi:high-affinity nickel-transport protein